MIDKKNIIIIILVGIIIPFIVAYGITIPTNIVGDNGQWLGFLGSYLGSVFSGLITLYVLMTTLNENRNIFIKSVEHDKEKYEKERKDKLTGALIEKIALTQIECAKVYYAAISLDDRCKAVDNGNRCKFINEFQIQMNDAVKLLYELSLFMKFYMPPNIENNLKNIINDVLPDIEKTISDIQSLMKLLGKEDNIGDYKDKVETLNLIQEKLEEFIRLCCA